MTVNMRSVDKMTLDYKTVDMRSVDKMILD